MTTEGMMVIYLFCYGHLEKVVDIRPQGSLFGDGGFFKKIFEDVAAADKAFQDAVFDDGHMPKAPFRHRPHDRAGIVMQPAGHHLPGI